MSDSNIPTTVKLNQLPDPIDDRDHIKVVVSAKETELPLSFTLAHFSGHAYNQGDVGACAAYAMCKAREILLRRKFSNHPKYMFSFAPFFTYALTRELQGHFNEDNGSYLRNVFLISNKIGMLPTENYEGLHWLYKPTEEERRFAQFGKIHGYERLLDIEAIKATIAIEQLPIVFGIEVFNTVTRSGMFVHTPRSISQGGHAMVIDSYDDTTRTFSGINSWGSAWGNNGRFSITYDYYKQFCFDSWSFAKDYY